MQGLIVENISNMYKVKAEDKIYESTARGKFKKEDITPVVGDMVELEIIDETNRKAVIKEIKNKIDNIIENLKKLELGESIIELKTFIEYFNELYNDFDKEKECKDLFKQNIKELGYRIDNINKVVRDIYLQIDDIKYNYNLSNEDINKFSLLNKSLEKINKDYKINEIKIKKKKRKI